MPTHTRRFYTRDSAIAFLQSLERGQNGSYTRLGLRGLSGKDKPWRVTYTPKKYLPKKGKKRASPPSANIRRFKRPFGEWRISKNSRPRSHVPYVGSGYGGKDMEAWRFYIERTQNGKTSHPRNYFIYAQPIGVGYSRREVWEVSVWMTTSTRSEPRHLNDYAHRTKKAAKAKMVKLQKSLYHHFKTSNRAQWNPPKS